MANWRDLVLNFLGSRDDNQAQVDNQGVGSTATGSASPNPTPSPSQQSSPVELESPFVATQFETESQLLDLFAADGDWTDISVLATDVKEIDDLLSVKRNLAETGQLDSVNTIELSTDVVYSGSQSIRFAASSPSPEMVTSKSSLETHRADSQAGDVVFLSGMFFIESGSPMGLFDLEQSANGAGLRLLLDEGGRPRIELKALQKLTYRTSDDVSIPTDEWVRISMRADLDAGQNGSLQLWIEDQLVIDVHDATTLPEADAFYDRLQIGITANPHGSDSVVYVDDFTSRHIGPDESGAIEFSDGTVVSWGPEAAAVPVALMEESSMDNDQSIDPVSDTGSVTGTDGADAMVGTVGHDVFFGGQGIDTLSGSAGDDVFVYLNAQDVDDRYEGGDGHDMVLNATSDGMVLETVPSGWNVEGIDANGSMILGTDNSNIFDFSGFELINVDAIAMGAGNDSVIGSNGSDRIAGEAGDDAIDGGLGDDVIHGGGGTDYLTGGEGMDRFVFEKGSDIDIIADFESGSGDILDLSRLGSRFDTIGEVSDVVSVNGSDIVFDFGQGHQLIIENRSTLDSDDLFFG